MPERHGKPPWWPDNESWPPKTGPGGEAWRGFGRHMFFRLMLFIAFLFVAGSLLAGWTAGLIRHRGPGWPVVLIPLLLLFLFFRMGRAVLGTGATHGQRQWPSGRR